MNELEPGRIYRIAAGYGWMFIGRFVRPAGLLGGVFSDAVNLCRTGGVAWDDLDRGIGRDRATFRRLTTGDLVLPAVTFAVPWNGEIPKV